MTSLRPSRVMWALAVVLAGVLAAGSGGCSTAERTRWNMSPELESVGRTPDQRKNMYARTVDTNFRQLNEDWDTFWLLDQPSLLSPYPMP